MVGEFGQPSVSLQPRSNLGVVCARVLAILPDHWFEPDFLMFGQAYLFQNLEHDQLRTAGVSCLAFELHSSMGSPRKPVHAKIIRLMETLGPEYG